MRKLPFLLLLLALPLCVSAKDKKDTVSPLILRAETIYLSYDTSINVADPTENQRARDAVDGALRKWGRFKLLAFPDDADLVVVIRKGGAVKRTVTGDRPPATISATDTNLSIGISAGRRPNTPAAQPPPPSAPTTEIGSSEDSFVVLQGRGGPTVVPDSAGGPALWRYMGKNALDGPAVNAVKEFQKAVEAAEKAAKKP